MCLLAIIIIVDSKCYLSTLYKKEKLLQQIEEEE